MRKKIILPILIALLLASILGMILYQRSLSRSQDINERLKELAASSRDAGDASAGNGDTEGGADENETDGNKAGSNKDDDSAGSKDKSKSKSTFVSPINFQALQEENPDIYGWIRMDDTVIDYPILQSSPQDPDYYEKHTVEGTEGYPGAIFTESDLNQEPFEDPVTVIYGHRMKNDTMFGSLDLWQEEDYREAHSQIQIFTQDHTYTYTIALVQVYDNRNILATYDCSSRKGYAAFLESLENVHSIPYWHSEELEISTDQSMIILSTCYGDNRLLIGAVLTEKQ